MSILRITRMNDIPAKYNLIMSLQDILFQHRKADLIPDTILLLHHAPVYTMGKRGTNQDFIQAHGVQEAIALGADIAAVPRGGETTFHGPGQLIAYPLINLRHLNMGARVYVETLEDIMIACARQYNITTAKGRIPGRTGVWVGEGGERKLGAVGVAISNGITRHGFALNVTTDLEWFRRIVPCGDAQREATSIERELALSLPSCSLGVEAGVTHNTSTSTTPAAALSVDVATAAEIVAQEASRRLISPSPPQHQQQNQRTIEWLPNVNELVKLYL